VISISGSSDKFFKWSDDDGDLTARSNTDLTHSRKTGSSEKDPFDIKFGSIDSLDDAEETVDPGIYGDIESKRYIDSLIERQIRESPYSSGTSVAPAQPAASAQAGSEKTDKKADNEESDGESDEKPVLRLEAYDWVQCVVSTVIVVILLFFFAARQISVDGYSMLDTLHHNDRLLVTSEYGEPEPGNIIILHTESFQAPLVKRVIAVAGQTLDFNTDLNRVEVDGVLIDEPYIRNGTMNGSWIDWDTSEYLNEEGKIVIPDGYVFAMGDNRNASADSRKSNVGFVDTRNIVGVVRLIVIPGADEYGSRDWSRFGIVH